jgi:hypothetical protein
VLLGSLAGQFGVALIGFAGIAVTAIVTYIGTRNRYLNDLARDYDLSLRKNRVAVYPELWALTEVFPHYGRERSRKVIDVGTLDDLADALRRWYYRRGGLFLSDETRRSYFALQDKLHDVAATHDRGRKLEYVEWKPLREAGSTLRTSLALDLLSRRPSALRELE